MSLETSLVTAISSLASGRVFPDIGPADALTPYITYQQVGGGSPTFMERTVPSKRNAVVQINVWSKTRLEANAIAMQIEAALVQSTALQVDVQGALIARHDEETKLYGAMQDFSIWSDR